MKALLLSAIVFGVLLDAIPSSAETIFHAASGACIHPSGGSTNPSDNTPLIFHYGDCSSGASKLQFRFLSGGAIQHIPSGKCVHPEGGSPNPPDNTRLVLHNGCNGGRIGFRVTSSGSIQHLTSGKCIHSEGGASRPSNDTQLVLHNGCNEPRLAFQIRSIQAQSPGFQTCNRSSTTLDVAYVTKRMGRFGSIGTGADTITESQGWWSVASGKCRVLYPGDASDVVGVYAQGGGKIWSGGYQYCINPTSRFNYGSEANSSPSVCRSQGGKSVSFVNVGSTESSQIFTFDN